MYRCLGIDAENILLIFSSQLGFRVLYFPHLQCVKFFFWTSDLCPDCVSWPAIDVYFYKDYGNTTLVAYNSQIQGVLKKIDASRDTLNKKYFRPFTCTTMISCPTYNRHLWTLTFWCQRIQEGC